MLALLPIHKSKDKNNVLLIHINKNNAGEDTAKLCLWYYMFLQL